MAVAEVVVLANSFKRGGRCVAGISVRTGDWVRPVSRRPHGALYPYHYRIDGRDAALLDTVGFEHRGRTGDPCQPENVEVGDDRWWRTGRLSAEEAGRALEPHLVEGPRLLGNRGAAVPEEDALTGVEASLALVRPRKIEFHLDAPVEGARHRPRASFELGGQDYDLSLTDTAVRPRLMDAGLGSHEPAGLGVDLNGDVLFTISLAEPHDGWCTKLVAAVIVVPRVS